MNEEWGKWNRAEMKEYELWGIHLTQEWEKQPGESCFQEAVCGTLGKVLALNSVSPIPALCSWVSYSPPYLSISEGSGEKYIVVSST